MVIPCLKKKKTLVTTVYLFWTYKTLTASIKQRNCYPIGFVNNVFLVLGEIAFN
jgi:hypothetical protein